MMLKFISIILSFFIVAWAGAQQQFSSKNKKAIKLYQEGQGKYDMREYDIAIVLFNDALKKDPAFVEAAVLAAYSYTEKGDYLNAIAFYEKAITINPRFYPENYASAGLLHLGLGNYEAAQKHLENYLGIQGKRLLMGAAARKALDDCIFAQEALKNPVDFKPVNMGPSINSPMPEYFPSFTADGKTLLYTRRLNDKDAYSGFNEDFYMSYKKDGKWSKSFNVKQLNSSVNEGAPTISANGQFIIFTSCADPMVGYGTGRKGFGSCDLFYSYRTGKRWSAPKNLNRPVNSNQWETQPTFSSDGKTLYFIRGSRGRGGIGQQDIFTSELSENGIWSKPVRLSNVVNTQGSEESVFIHPDGNTLYFSSDGHIGMGGLDIYMTQKDEKGEWTKPVNLGYPINTFGNENSLMVSADGKLAYFASDREGGLGDLDLYQFDLPEKYRPNALTYLKGKVFDKADNSVVAARFELLDVNTNEVIAQSYADSETGEYLVCLPANKEYALNVSQDGYLFYSENFSLGKSIDSKPFIKDVPLSKINVGESVVLKNVFFETGKFELQEKSQVELNKLVAFMQKNANIKVEIGGHTDNVGSSQSNKVLSNQRADVVKKYLIDKGIVGERLTSKGYGDVEPIAKNDTPQGRAENRRTAFKIVAK